MNKIITSYQMGQQIFFRDNILGITEKQLQKISFKAGVPMMELGCYHMIRLALLKEMREKLKECFIIARLKDKNRSIHVDVDCINYILARQKDYLCVYYTNEEEDKEYEYESEESNSEDDDLTEEEEEEEYKKIGIFSQLESIYSTMNDEDREYIFVGDLSDEIKPFKCDCNDRIGKEYDWCCIYCERCCCNECKLEIYDYNIEYNDYQLDKLAVPNRDLILTHKGAISEIRRQQKSIEFCIPQRSFGMLVIEILTDIGVDGASISEDALNIFQSYIEDFLRKRIIMASLVMTKRYKEYNDLILKTTDFHE